MKTFSVPPEELDPLEGAGAAGGEDETVPVPAEGVHRVAVHGEAGLGGLHPVDVGEIRHQGALHLADGPVLDVLEGASPLVGELALAIGRRPS